MNNKKRILIIEDEENWQEKLLRLNLLKNMKKNNPNSVDLVKDFNDAITKLDSSNYDLAITDVYLEENSGIWEWTNIAKILKERQIPIIAISQFFEKDLMTLMVNEYGVTGLFEKQKLYQKDFQKCIERVLNISNIDLQKSKKDNLIRWLHLSDLHFGSKNDSFDRNLVNDAFWRDLVNFKNNGFQIDFIIITGDIAYSGKSSEYERAKDFLDKLLEVTRLTKKRLFIIPGNHDVNRDEIDDPIRNLCKFNNRETIRETMENPEIVKLILRRLDNYFRFIKTYFSDVKNFMLFDDIGYFFSKVIKIKNKRIAFLGLNSAWSSGNNKVGDKIKDKGELFIGEKQIVDALNNTKNADLKIVLMHHPLYFVNDIEKEDIESHIFRNCDFYLRGHLHQNDFERYTSTKGKIITIPSGAMYQGRDLVNSYNYVIFDFEDKTGQVIFRRYSNYQKEWLKDLDTTGENNDGIISFVL